MIQSTIFDLMYEPFKITKPIKLIEFFAGYGSQALALKYLGIPFEHHKICEWAVKSIQAYKDIHMTNDTTDYSKELSTEEIKEYLFNKGISQNYNDPMTKQQVDRLNEKVARTIYNNIQATHNLVNIQQVKGDDLNIDDVEHFTYLLTYSFPCQDLSLAGKGKGMSDTSTRSGMLWEVERILKECKELGTLPDVLLMENVPQVHSKDNIDDFYKWQLSLESMGYQNYYQDLIATDYGIPQTRNRCFMVSILGDYNYTFPKPIPLKLKLKDLLEDNVDEKYYLSEKGMQYICENAYNPHLKDHIDRSKTKLNKEIAYTISTKQDRRCGDANFILDGYGETSIGDFLKIKNATKKGYLEASDGDGIDISSRMEHHRGTVQKGKAQTLTTSCDIGVVNNNLKIRKITCKEAFRLMGVKDEDYEKVAKNQSNASLYHLAGDSIVVNVLMAIFKNML
jgi:DNA (cytosine-5)-methyltransferase 1